MEKIKNDIQKRVCQTEYKPNCYVLVSASQRPLDETLGDVQVNTNITFLFDGGSTCVEWEPKHGPVQLWHKCGEGDEDARPHHFYDWHNTTPLSWSQLAVGDNQLPQAMLRGDYDYIFGILGEWV